MTIAAGNRIAGPYIGNTVAVAFPFGFKIFATTDIVATLTLISSGANTTLTLNSDYTVTMNADQNANPGGTVNYNPLGVPMDALHQLTITSNVPMTQGLSLTIGGGFSPANISDALDRGVILTQQLALTVGRGLTVAITETAPGPLPTAAARAGGFLAFDLSGNPIVATGVTGAPVSVAMTPVVAAATLPAALALLGGATTTRQVIAGAGLSGGGDLSADRTITLDLSAKNAWTGTQASAVGNLTSGAGSNFSAGQSWKASVNGSTFTFTNPTTNPTVDGSCVLIYITYATSNTVAFGTSFVNTAQFTASATAGKQDCLLFRWNATSSKYELVAFALDTGKA